MSRFSDDGPDDLESLLAYGRWMGRRKAVLNGRPGKMALKQLEQALLQMPYKRLIDGTLSDGSGVCANGAWVYRQYVNNGMTPKAAWKKLRKEGRAKGINRYYDDSLGRTVDVSTKELGITQTLAELVAFENDEGLLYGIKDRNSITSQEKRYQSVLEWVQFHMEKSE